MKKLNAKTTFLPILLYLFANLQVQREQSGYFALSYRVLYAVQQKNPFPRYISMIQIASSFLKLQYYSTYKYIYGGKPNLMYHGHIHRVKNYTEEKANVVLCLLGIQ